MIVVVQIIEAHITIFLYCWKGVGRGREYAYESIRWQFLFPLWYLNRHIALFDVSNQLKIQKMYQQGHIIS